VANTTTLCAAGVDLPKYLFGRPMDQLPAKRDCRSASSAIYKRIV
jgi:hypothetical protein